MAKRRDPQAGNIGLGPHDAGLGGIRPDQAIGLGPHDAGLAHAPAPYRLSGAHDSCSDELDENLTLRRNGHLTPQRHRDRRCSAIIL